MQNQKLLKNNNNRQLKPCSVTPNREQEQLAELREQPGPPLLEPGQREEAGKPGF